jgi:hypothetical protein
MISWMRRFPKVKRVLRQSAPEPEPEVKAKPELDPCPICGAPTKPSTSIVEHVTVLHCKVCKKMGVKGSYAREYVDDSLPSDIATNLLANVAEDMRRHHEMITSDDFDPRWTRLS